MLRKVSSLHLYGLLLFLLLPMAARQPVQALPATQTTATASAEAKLEQANKAVIQRFYEEVVNHKHPEVLGELFDPSIVSHDLDYGADGLDIAKLLPTMPDIKATVSL